MLDTQSTPEFGPPDLMDEVNRNHNELDMKMNEKEVHALETGELGPYVEAKNEHNQFVKRISGGLGFINSAHKLRLLANPNTQEQPSISVASQSIFFNQVSECMQHQSDPDASINKMKTR
jgi:hypothetical protein